MFLDSHTHLNIYSYKRFNIKNDDIIDEINKNEIFKLFLSKSKNKLLSIHSKGAEKDVLDLITKYKNTKVIIHWYSGNYHILKEMISKGFFFSIGPEILISDNIKKIVELIPTDLILTETDNPGGPASIMNKTFMPSLIIEVIEEIAKIKKIEVNELKYKIIANFKTLINGLNLSNTINNFLL